MGHGGDGDTGLGRVARGGAVGMAGAAAGAALNVALVVAVTRAFDQETAGAFFSATSVFLIVVAVAGLGTPNALVHFTARSRALGAAGRVPALLRAALGPATAVAVLLAGVLAVLADDFAAWLGVPEAATYLRLLAPFLPFAVCMEAALAVSRGFRDMRASALLDKVARPLAQLALLGAVTASGGAALLAVAWAGPYLPAAVLAWWWMRRIARGPAAGPSADDAGAVVPRPVARRELWSFALPRSLADIAQIGNQRSGIVLVAALRGAADAALFTAATRFMVVGQFGAQAIQFAVQPRLAELLAVGDRDGANRLYQASTAWLICLAWPLYLLTVVYAPLLLRLFGADYAAGAEVLVVITLTMLLASGCGMGDLVLMTAGRTSRNLLNNLASLTVNVALCLLLVPMWGAVGGALAWSAAIVLRNLAPIVQLAGSRGLHPWSRAWPLAAGVCLWWFGAVPLALQALLGGGVVSLAVALAVGGAGHAVSLWRLRVPLALDGLRAPLRGRGEAVTSTTTRHHVK
ncbi:lipopolysaccharide biosynthesis protein [Marinactinospora thermotolerans]|uniref:Membrane protein involved in the export of O-antigen and teichoic acid n=1 Tax=Marinactinospora thermotolerans DSM 45154 TaxID=1122192 RepID=A0A1T4SYQ3_9ACTN|nr:oligosaccharide flippase family protein [Marinactinospora thermotolerans]SKA33376.1 Membrane protein involved in the export of O-antigen and teichoic acid [Marinactinospora thermotolerans DSM 45154]